MYEQENNSNESKNRTVANSVGQKKSNVKQILGFAENRPEAIAQRKLREMINNNQSNPGSRKAAEIFFSGSVSDYVPIQLKGWVWTSGAWQEIDPAEKGKSVPGDIKGDAEGEVYDPDTNEWYHNIASYRQYTAKLTNPPFVTPPCPAEEMLIKVNSQIPTSVYGRDCLDSFLYKGVQTPGSMQKGSFTTSADEKSRPDQISVNKVGPFKDDCEAEKVAFYASMNPANGAIPVAIENSADRVPENQVPDPMAIAIRAHNSALAVIDPSGLGTDVHRAIAMSTSAGTEMTLSSSIPSSSFVCLIVPVQLRPIITAEQIKRFNIQFVGSVDSRVPFNYKNTEKQSREVLIDTKVPDYANALAAIFKANPQSVFLTHVIRLNPSISINTTDKKETEDVVATTTVPTIDLTSTETPSKLSTASDSATSISVFEEISSGKWRRTDGVDPEKIFNKEGDQDPLFINIDDASDEYEANGEMSLR